MLLVAATAGAFTWIWHGVDWAGSLAAVAFLAALVIRVALLSERPERVWYEGRAAAESAKTLAWRFAVGGEPFGVEALGVQAAETKLLSRLHEILTDLRGLHLVPPNDAGEQITNAMRDMRVKSLHERKTCYELGRIATQRKWYADRSRWNRDQALLWSYRLLAVEVLGAIGAILKAVGMLQLDLLGLAGTAAAAGTSWLAAKQHETLAEAYSVTAQELAVVAARMDQAQTEASWARFVDDAEEAISREHTLWRASHR